MARWGHYCNVQHNRACQPGSNRIWWLCLVSTSTTGVTSDLGYGMDKSLIGLYKENTFYEQRHHSSTWNNERILKTIFGLHASVIFRLQYVWIQVHIYVCLIPNSSGGQLAELIVYIIKPRYRVSHSDFTRMRGPQHNRWSSRPNCASWYRKFSRDLGCHFVMLFAHQNSWQNHQHLRQQQHHHHHHQQQQQNTTTTKTHCCYLCEIKWSVDLLFLLLTCITCNPSMDEQSHAQKKYEMTLVIHSQTSTVQPLKFGNG